MELLDFTLNGRAGRLAIEYRINDSIERSGFDMFDPADFDPAVALGYPTLNAWVQDYAGAGYRTASAFIQWIEVDRRGPGPGSARELDTLGAFGEHNVPFFSLGYPANIYDAPAHNMQGSTWMRWVATTWFVTLPARWTGHEVRPLLGFKWGYEEDQKVGVTPLKLEHVGIESWSCSLEWLRSESPGFRFAGA